MQRLEQLPELYDTHCHLDFSEFDGGRGALLDACASANVSRLIVPSVARSSWGKVRAIAKGRVNLFVAFGLHPLFVEEHSLDDLAVLRDLLSERHFNLVALGEIGLDAEAGEMPFQQRLFDEQLSMAQEFSLPVILHARRTHSEILSALKRVNVSGVIHAFSGNEQLLNQYISKGVSIGVGCVITWPSAHRTRDAISKAPLSRLVLETDSPDMRVAAHKDDMAGSPLHVRQVFDALCDIRSESPDQLARALRENADRLFFSKMEEKRN